jgi:hypothetical protein
MSLLEDFIKIHLTTHPCAVKKSFLVPGAIEKVSFTVHDVGGNPAPVTRTCGTCSRNCDVGVACWWCGQ